MEAEKKLEYKVYFLIVQKVLSVHIIFGGDGKWPFAAITVSRDALISHC